MNLTTILKWNHPAIPELRIGGQITLTVQGHIAAVEADRVCVGEGDGMLGEYVRLTVETTEINIT